MLHTYIHPLCLGNISGDFSANNMKKITCVYNFSVNCTSNIINIHKYLMKKHDIK